LSGYDESLTEGTCRGAPFLVGGAISLAVLASSCSLLNQSVGPDVTTCAELHGAASVCTDDVIASCVGEEIAYLDCTTWGEHCFLAPTGYHDCAPDAPPLPTGCAPNGTACPIGGPPPLYNDRSGVCVSGLCRLPCGNWTECQREGVPGIPECASFSLAERMNGASGPLVSGAVGLCE
jgi:hypothetical protein